MILIAILGFGMLIGWAAELLLGGRGRPGAKSLVAGLVGSVVGGLLASLLAGDGFNLRPSGVVGSIVGAVTVLVVWRVVSAGRDAPAPRRDRTPQRGPTPRRKGGGQGKGGRQGKRRAGKGKARRRT